MYYANWKWTSCWEKSLHWCCYNMPRHIDQGTFSNMCRQFLEQFEMPNHASKCLVMLFKVRRPHALADDVVSMLCHTCMRFQTMLFVRRSLTSSSILLNKEISLGLLRKRTVNQYGPNTREFLKRTILQTLQLLLPECADFEKVHHVGVFAFRECLHS